MLTLCWPGSTSPRHGQSSGIGGRSLACEGRAIYDMAIGYEVGQSRRSRRPDGPGPPRGRPLRHHPELHRPERPAEGPDGRVAQANQGTPAAVLAMTAWDDHEKGLSLTLRQLVAPDWYWYSGPAAYNQGAPLVNYLLRVYGPERFLKLYTTCQQATFEADCRATLGIGLDELDAAFWADTEQIARRADRPPASGSRASSSTPASTPPPGMRS